MDHQDFKALLRRYIADTCTPHERRDVERLILKHPIAGGWKWKSETHREMRKKQMQDRIFNQIDQGTKRGIIGVKYWISIAASLIFVIGISMFFLFYKNEDLPDRRVIIQSKLEPHDDVTLTYATGEIAVLTDKNGVLDLRQSPTNKEGETLVGHSLNTLRVPSQHQFAVVLMDGTKVWLNAGSSLTYPTRFDVTDRTVTLAGEGYFEVAKNSGRPFKVRAKQTEIVVTGTKFNISAYSSESRIITSLFEGGVEFVMGKKQYKLTPGYEIVANGDNNTVQLQQVDMDQALAWKDGYFVFNDLDLVSVMRHVARWYNISVTAPIISHPKRIGGTFPNTASLDDLLKDLEILSGVKFIRKGKEVQMIY